MNRMLHLGAVVIAIALSITSTAAIADGVGAGLFGGGVIAIALLVCAGCGPQTIVMKNPKTNEVAQCSGTNVGFPILNASQVNDCVAGYEQAG